MIFIRATSRPKNIIASISLWLLCLALPLKVLSAVYLTGLDMKPNRSESRFIFLLSAKTVGRLQYLPAASQVIVELSNTSKNFALQSTSLGEDANVASVTAEKTFLGGLRFIFTVRGPVDPGIQFLPSKAGKMLQLQLDIKSVRSGAKAGTSKKLTTTPLTKTHVREVLDDIAHEFNKRPALFTVVIDAGHGGKDSGAVGKNGIEEKNVVLQIARLLQQEINRTPNLRAVMTRKGDYFVPLRQRLNLARKGNADLFIAIHADAAYADSKAAGASVYALSQHGATSEAARWLAQRDNYSELGNVEFNQLKDRSPLLRSVLIDLAQTATIQDSIRLGDDVLSALETFSQLHYKEVEQAPFMVLKSPDIPSILVETGFISNPREEQRLQNKVYQKRIAQALRQGISAYVQKYAVAGE